MKRLKLFKTLLVVAIMLVGGANFAWADPIETVGNTDNTSAFWSAFSDYYTIQPNRSLRLSFTNHSDKAKTFHTWVGVITSDFDRASAAASDTEGYWEYLVLRGDDGRWGNSSAAGTFTSNFTRSGDDDATVEEWLDGAHVELTISRSSSTVTMRADMYSTAGDYYWEQMVITAGTGTQNIRFFLTTQNGHLTDVAQNSEDVDIYYYQQDFNSQPSIWTVAVDGVSYAIKSGTDYYAYQNGRGSGHNAALTKPSWDYYSRVSSYQIEFDYALKASTYNNSYIGLLDNNTVMNSGNNKRFDYGFTQYSSDNATNNIIWFQQTGSNVLTFKNDANETPATITLTSEAWYHFVINVNKSTKVISYTITKVGENTPTATGSYTSDNASVECKGIALAAARAGGYKFDNFELVASGTEAITTSVSTSAVNLSAGKATVAVSTETNAVTSTIKQYYSTSPLLTSPVEISDGSVELASGTYYFYSVNTVSGSKSNSVQYEVEATETVSAPTVTYTGNTITLTAHGTSDAGGSIAGTYYVANAPSANPATEGTLLTLNTPTTVPQGYYYIYSVSEYGNASAEPATAMSIARSQETFDFLTAANNRYEILSNLGTGDSGDYKLSKLTNSAGAVAEFINGRIECSYANGNANYWWMRYNGSVGNKYNGLFISSGKSDDLYVKVSAQDVVVFTWAEGGLTFSGTPNVYGDGIVDGSAVVSGTKYMAKANGYIKVHGTAYTTIKSIVVYSDDADMVAAPVLSSSANIVNVIAGGSADDDAVITSYYTTNGDTPTTSSTSVADNKIVLGPGSYTVKVMSYNATTKTASSVESIEVVVPATVSKTISAAGWATYCSPYPLDFSDDIDNLTDVFIITGSQTPGAESGYVSMTSVKGGTVPANTGLLIKGTAGTVTIPVVASSSTDVSGNKLIGVTTATTLDLDDDDDGTADTQIYVLLNETTGEKRGIGFYLTETSVTSFSLGANSAYLPADFAGAAGARFFLLFSDETTGINNLNADLNLNNKVFDLQGRRVAQPTKGLYIVNGKKVVVK